MNNFLLWLIALFNPLFKHYGVNTWQLDIILRYKLMVDDRSPSALMGNRKNTNGKYADVFKMLLLTLFGLALTALLFLVHSPLVAHTIYFVAFMFMVTSMLITDFTNVLIDVRDNYTLLCRPVNDRTISISRIMHICLHLSKVVAPMGISALLYVLIKDGMVAGGIFLVELLSATLFCVFMVNAIYLLMLKLIRPEKFRDFLVYFQVAFTVILLMAYFILPKVMDFDQLDTVNFSDYLISYFLPPFWIAGLHELAIGNFNTLTMCLAGLSLLMPFLCIFLVIRFLAPNFNKKIALMALAGQTDETIEATTITNVPKKITFSEKLAKWVTKSPLESAGFLLTWRLSGRLHEFKRNSYPSMAIIPCYFVYFMFNSSKDQSFAEKWRDLPNGNSYLFLFYLICILSIIVLQQVMRSDQYKAAWVYHISPNKQPGELLMGTFKAMLFKFHLPATIVILIFVLWIWGWQIGVDILLAIINVLLTSIVLAYYLTRNFPFSLPNKIKDQTGKMILYMFFALFPVGLGFLHNFLARWPWAIALFMLVSATLTWYYSRLYFRLGWDKIA